MLDPIQVEYITLEFRLIDFMKVVDSKANTYQRKQRTRSNTGITILQNVIFQKDLLFMNN